MNKRISILAVALVTMLAVSCGSGGGAGNFNLISIPEEWQLGDQLSQDVARQVHLNTDAEINEYITSMGQKIVAGTDAPFNQLPWHFHVVDDPAINAFAIPGGHVYVNTGLIAAAENASELAGVLAHEISHVTARHTTEAISRQYGLSVLAGLVLGQNPSALTEITAQIIAGGAMARFSRDDEREADKLGIQAMYNAGYDPRGMGAMFRVLQAREQSNPGSVAQFFSTHPTTDDRIRDADSRAASLARSAGLVTDEPRFQAIKSRLA